MMNRFAESTCSTINELIQDSKNKNTEKSTRLWVSVYKEWANLRGACISLELMNNEVLNETLCVFYAEVRKKDSSEYEPDCLRVMQAAFHRYLIEKKYEGNIMKDDIFTNCRNVLEGKARKLRCAGMGKRPNAREPISKQDEMNLWSSGRLGRFDGPTLVRTMWYLNMQYFGLRGIQEHTDMCMENFVRKLDDNGNVYIEFRENPTKTRQYGLNPNIRTTFPKMFANGGDHCPVSFFDFYISKRPTDMKETGRFYLNPKKHQFSDSVWFTRNPMGKNSVSHIMKKIVEGTELEGKNISNHSGRKTLVKKLKQANIAESSIIKVTGHKSVAGLKSYDPGDEMEFREMSNALASQPGPPQLSKMQHQSLHSLTSHGEGQQVYNQNCEVTINYVQKQYCTQKRKRVNIIYSSDSSQEI